ncbi:virulence RhuM family protein [Wolbachia endosymbiont of Wuchereria bancrofti]|nr:virulence RhuM family protein [Wolbachia endosymbiont of Wuchereria bancrofti]
MRAFSSRKKNGRVVSILEITASDCKKYPTQFYNLDAILAVGYRVSSQKATAFRVWATKILKEFIIKGFVSDKKQLKYGDKFDESYFDKLLEKIREIQTSERRFYQRLRIFMLNALLIMI